VPNLGHISFGGDGVYKERNTFKLVSTKISYSMNRAHGEIVLEAEIVGNVDRT
jgi:hypothetical protein